MDQVSFKAGFGEVMDFDWRHRGTGRNEFLNGGMSYDTMLYIHPFGGFYGQAVLIWRRHETETWESYRRSSSGFISYGNGQVQLSEFKGPPVVIYGCELDHKEGRGSKN